MKCVTMLAIIPSLATIAVNSTQAQTTTKTQPINAVLPSTPPNTVLQIKRQSGNCPKTLGLWTATRQYEGGGEFTIIADTKPFAGLADLTSSGKKFVEYTAPLHKTYASCVGAVYGESEYRVHFRKGNVVFRLQIPKDTPANPTGFSSTAILGSRPYVKWQIAD